MKHDAAHYEASAYAAVKDACENAHEYHAHATLIAQAQVWATLAVAAATLEAARTAYPANHPLAQETT